MTGTEVRAIRIRLKLTQQELADKVGVTRVTVARWELGLMGIRQSASRLLQFLAAQSERKRDGKNRKVSQARVRRS
jgi:transcriptional regulator with XRE-family HTH domain